MIYIKAEYYVALKVGNSNTCYNMEKPWEYYAKRNKPVSKRDTTWFQLYECESC